MVDLGFLFESVLGLFTRIFGISFYVWGIQVNVGMMFLFALCVSLILCFLDKLGE